MQNSRGNVPKDIPIFNFDQPKTKAIVKQYVNGLEGLWQVEFTRCKDQRSLQANAYYWSTVLPRVQAGIKNQWGDKLDRMQTHELCLVHHSSTTVVNRLTGEETRVAKKRSSKMNKEEFSDFLETVMKLAADLGEYVASPGEVLEGDTPRLRQAVGAHADDTK